MYDLYVDNYFVDVGNFHVKFDLPVSAETHSASKSARNPQVLSKQEFHYRDAFLHEEHREFIEGYAEKNLAKMADALADIVWIALGTAHYLGIPFDAVWQEVKRANMEKRPWAEGDPVKPRNVVGMEVVKPQGWKPPAVEDTIQAFTAIYFPTVNV